MKLTPVLGWLGCCAAFAVTWLNASSHTIASSTASSTAVQPTQRSDQVLSQQEAVEQASPNLDEYIGLQYGVSQVGEQATLPGSPVIMGGWVIGNPYASNGVDGRYGVSQFLLGDDMLIFLEAYVSYDSSGRPTRRILDAIRLPINGMVSGGGSGEYNVQSSCFLGEREDPEILAVVRQDDSEYLTEIRQAWRTNRSTGRIEEIPTSGIRCHNFGWGV